MTIETAWRASLEFVCIFGHDGLRRLAVFRFGAPFLRMENLGRFRGEQPIRLLHFLVSDSLLEGCGQGQGCFSRNADENRYLARTNGARLIVVALPTRDQVYSGRCLGTTTISICRRHMLVFLPERRTFRPAPTARAYVAETNKNLSCAAIPT